MIKELMSSRRFAPLFWAQFFSALNDNVLKNALVIILLYGAATAHGDALVTVAGGLHLSLLHPLRSRRRARRQIRQVGRRAAAEIRRDLCRDLRSTRLLPAFGAAAVRGARTVRHHRRAVRPGEIRHAARPALGRRTRHRQRAGRRRDLHGDPDRHHRRRAVRLGLDPYGAGVDRGRGAVAGLLGVCLAHSGAPRRPRPIFASPPIPGPRRCIC